VGTVGCTSTRYRCPWILPRGTQSGDPSCYHTLDALCMLSSENVPTAVLGTEMSKQMLEKGEGRYLRGCSNRKIFTLHSFIRVSMWSTPVQRTRKRIPMPSNNGYLTCSLPNNCTSEPIYWIAQKRQRNMTRIG